jgi:capsid portal protein
VVLVLKYAKPRNYPNISRYEIYRQIIDNDNNIYVETANQTPVDESQNDKYHEVLQEEENRLDIISNKYYGNPEFWWVIAVGNNLVDPFVIKVGDIIRIPSFTSLTHWNGALYGRV